MMYICKIKNFINHPTFFLNGSAMSISKKYGKRERSINFISYFKMPSNKVNSPTFDMIAF